MCPRNKTVQENFEFKQKYYMFFLGTQLHRVSLGQETYGLTRPLSSSSFSPPLPLRPWNEGGVEDRRKSRACRAEVAIFLPPLLPFPPSPASEKRTLPSSPPSTPQLGEKRGGLKKRLALKKKNLIIREKYARYIRRMYLPFRRTLFILEYEVMIFPSPAATLGVRMPENKKGTLSLICGVEYTGSP